MKMTLLEMTQNIANAMSSDSVNSISDTEESLMIAEIIKECYYLLMSKRDWPFLQKLTNLEGVSDTSNPTLMKIPDLMNKIFWIRYNKKDVEYLPPKQFKAYIDSRVEQAGVIDSNGYGLNKDPVYWTTYDDKYVVFSDRNQLVDATLQQSKSAVFGVKVASWTHADDFIPDIPEKFFPTLLAEAKSTCFIDLKQQPNQKEEVRAQKGLTQMHKEAWKNDLGESKTNDLVDYGRRGYARQSRFRQS